MRFTNETRSFFGIQASHGKIVTGHLAFFKTINAASGSKRKLNSTPLFNVLPKPKIVNYIRVIFSIFLNTYEIQNMYLQL